MTPEQFRSLLSVLHRIADALDERNIAYAENKAKDEKITQERIEIERHILALHKLNVTREQTWHKEQKQLLEKQSREIIEQNTRTYEKWLTIMQEERDKVQEPTITKWSNTGD